MYARYNFTAGSAYADILSDVTAILTGETNIANLSAACDQALTTIDARIPAGWTVHDAAADTDAKCLKAPHADDPTQFKYALIGQLPSILTLSNYARAWDDHMSLVGCEDWDAVNKVATNPNKGYVNGSSTSYNGAVDSECNPSQRHKQQAFDRAGGASIHLYAVQGALMIHCVSTGWSGCNISNYAYGQVELAGVTSVLFEHSRLGFDNEVGSYPSFVSGPLAQWGHPALRACRSSYGIAYGSVGTMQSNHWAYNSGTGTYYGYIPFPQRNLNGVLSHVFMPIFVAQNAVGYMGGNVSEVADIWHSTVNFGQIGDLIQLDNGNTYVIFPVGSSKRLAARLV